MTALSQKQFGRLERAFPDGCDVFGFGPFLFVIRRPKFRRVEEPAPMRTVSLQPLKVRARATKPEPDADVIEVAKAIVDILERRGGPLSQPYLLRFTLDREDTKANIFWPAFKYCVDSGWVTVADNGHVQLVTKAKN